MKEKLTKESVDFTQIKNEVLQDKKLSLKAKGLFAYMYSKPDDWDFSGDRIAKENADGRKSIYVALKELESLNYLDRIKRPDGKSDYYIHYSKKPNAPKSKEPKRQRAKKVRISNKELITNIDPITNKEEKLTQKTQKFIEEVEDCLKNEAINKGVIDELKDFVSYWTEPNKSKTKIRWEMQKTWEMKRRIRTWMNNKKVWGTKKEDNKYQVIISEDNL